jgi:hypothetical protein
VPSCGVKGSLEGKPLALQPAYQSDETILSWHAPHTASGVAWCPTAWLQRPISLSFAQVAPRKPRKHVLLTPGGPTRCAAQLDWFVANFPNDNPDYSTAVDFFQNTTVRQLCGGIMVDADGNENLCQQPAGVLVPHPNHASFCCVVLSCVCAASHAACSRKTARPM